MHLIGIVGCALALLGPPAMILAVMYRKHPQALLVCGFSTFVALIAYSITGAVHSVYVSFAGVPSLADSAPHVVTLAIISVGVSGAARVVVCYLMCRLNRWLTGLDHALIVSHFQLSVIFTAVGIGFGLAAAVIGPLALLEATLQLRYVSLVVQHAAFDVEDAAIDTHFSIISYDQDVCPQHARLVHMTIQTVLLWACQIAWAILTGRVCWTLTHSTRTSVVKPPIDMVSDFNFKIGATHRRLVDVSVAHTRKDSEKLRSSASPAQYHAVRNADPDARERDSLAPQREEEQLLQDTVENDEFQEDDTESSTSLNAAVNAPLNSEKNASTGVATGVDQLYSSSEKYAEEMLSGNFVTRLTSLVLSKKRLLACIIVLVAPLFLHLLFALTSLFHTGGALSSRGDFAVDLTRGCAMSLLAQLIIATFSVVSAGFVLIDDFRRSTALLAAVPHKF